MPTPAKKKAKRTPSAKNKRQQQTSANLVRYGSERPAQIDIAVYCFPYAGGSSSAFAEWARACLAWMSVVAVELPGRGSAAGDTLPASHTDDAALVSELARQIREDFQASSATSIAVVGLSMGVLMAIETQQLLADLPIVHSFFAGRAPVRDSSSHASVLDQASVDSLNLAPAEVRESEAWENYFLPMLTADLASDSRAANRLSAADTPARIRGDMDVFCGLSDPSFAPQSADQWREFVSADAHFDRHYFFGGHEFLKTSAEQIFGRIQASLSVKITESISPLGDSLARQSFGKGSRGHSDMISSVAWERVLFPYTIYAAYA